MKRNSELLFGATRYTTRVDLWSAGCVFAHLLIGEPLFFAGSNMDQVCKFYHPTIIVTKKARPGTTEL